MLVATQNISPITFKGTFEIFQNSRFLNIIAKHNQMDIVNKEGLNILMSRSPLFGHMQGTLGSPEVVGDAVKWIEKIQDIDCAYLKVFTSQKIDHWQKYSDGPEDNCNMVVDLSLGEEEILKNCSKSCRRNIRLGEKKGVTVRLAESVKDIEDFYEVLDIISGGGEKFEVLPIALISELFESGFIRLFLAYGDGHLIGGELFMVDHNMYDWYGGINKEFSYLKPGNYLLFEAIRWGIANQKKYLDFGQQSLSENKSIADFKMSFGSVIKPAYVYNIPKSPFKVMVEKFKKVLGRG